MGWQLSGHRMIIRSISPKRLEVTTPTPVFVARLELLQLLTPELLTPDSSPVTTARSLHS